MKGSSKIIDHDKVFNTSSPLKSFGRLSRRSAITDDFFIRTIDHKTNEHRTTDFIPVTDHVFGSFSNFVTTSALALTLALPFLFMLTLGNLGGPQSANIDKITTSSITSSLKNNNFKIGRVHLLKIIKGSSEIASITGNITNISDQNKRSPLLMISLVNSKGKQVQSWRYRPDLAYIKNGSILKFKTSAIDITKSASSVIVTMVTK